MFCPKYNLLGRLNEFPSRLGIQVVPPERWCKNVIYIYIRREIFQLNCSLIFYFPFFWAWKNVNEMHSIVPEGMDVTFFISRLQENKGAIGLARDFLRFSFIFREASRRSISRDSFNIGIPLTE